MTTYDIDISVRDEDSAELLDLLEAAGAGKVELLPSLGMTGVEVLVEALISLGALANFTERIAERWKCGVIIDARGEEVHVEKNCDLPRGDVLILTGNDTKALLHRPKRTDIEALLVKAKS